MEDEIKNLGGRPKKLKEEDLPFSISSKFAEIITSDYNQSTSLLIVGKTGAGKSNAALKICYDTAVKVAKIKGGTWKDYFSIDNIAVISNEEIYSVVQRMDRKFNCYICDDIGVGLNSRKWQSQTNILMNDILQTMRTTNTLVILTVPMGFMLDKVTRNLPHYYMEMEMAIFEKGISIGKFFEVSHRPRQNKVFHVYLADRKRGTKTVRAYFELAPEELRAKYEEKRREVAEKLRDEKMAQFKELMDETMGVVAEKPKKVTKAGRFIEIQRDVNAGIYKDLREGLKANNFSAPGDLSYARNAISSYTGTI